MKPKLVNGFRLWYHGYNGELDDYARHLLRAKTRKTHWTWRFYGFRKCPVALVESSDASTLRDQIAFIEHLAVTDTDVDVYLTNWVNFPGANVKNIPPHVREVGDVVDEFHKRRRLMEPAMIRELCKHGPLTIAPRPWEDKDYDEFACNADIPYGRLEMLWKESRETDYFHLGSRFQVDFAHPQKGDIFNYDDGDPFPPPQICEVSLS